MDFDENDDNGEPSDNTNAETDDNISESSETNHLRDLYNHFEQNSPESTLKLEKVDRYYKETLDNAKLETEIVV